MSSFFPLSVALSIHKLLSLSPQLFVTLFLSHSPAHSLPSFVLLFRITHLSLPFLTSLLSPSFPLSPSSHTPHPPHLPSQIHEAHIMSVRSLPPQQLNPELLGSLNMRKSLLQNYLTFPPIPHRVLRSDPRSTFIK